MFNKPSCEEANASLEPSGENAGAPLCPGKEATTLREPEPKSCTTSVIFCSQKIRMLNVYHLETKLET